LLDKFTGISFATGTRFRAEVDEIVGVVVTLAHYVLLGVVEEWEELGEEASSSFGRELVVKPPHA
jgi:hypothetical protein